MSVGAFGHSVQHYVMVWDFEHGSACTSPIGSWCIKQCPIAWTLISVLWFVVSGDEDHRLAYLYPLSLPRWPRKGSVPTNENIMPYIWYEQSGNDFFSARQETRSQAVLIKLASMSGVEADVFGWTTSQKSRSIIHKQAASMHQLSD